jgi:hypothetical protein
MGAMMAAEIGENLVVIESFARADKPIFQPALPAKAVYRVRRDAEISGQLAFREEGRIHISPRNFWILDRVRNRRTLILPLTRKRPHDIDMPTSAAISSIVSARLRAWEINLLMSSRSPSDAFMLYIIRFLPYLSSILFFYKA